MSGKTSQRLGWVVLVGCLLQAWPATAPAARPSSPGGKDSDAKATAAQRGKSSPRRLPKYFAQLKLAQEQRERILAIQERYASQLVAKQALMEETRKELDKLRKDQEREFNRVLKTAQRRQLQELRSKSKRSQQKKKRRE